MRILCVMLAVLSLGAVSGAQEPTPSRKTPFAPGYYDVDSGPALEQPSLKVGPVTVRLGMTKSELQSKLSEAELLKAGEDMWLIGYRGEQPTAGSVLFKNGVVVVASRSWLTAGSAVADALIGAIDSFSQEGLRDCVISHRTISLPGGRTEAATIQCGVKRLIISKGKLAPTEKSAASETEDVEEVIGSD